MNDSSIPFHTRLNNYGAKVLSVCRRIVGITKSISSPNNEPLLLWSTPIPIGTQLSSEQKKQFIEIVATGENSAKMADFKVFDQLNVSLADGGKFACNKNGHFSSIGMYMNQKHLHNSYIFFFSYSCK